MAQINISRLEATHSAFPSVCMVCGLPATVLQQVTVAQESAWAYGGDSVFARILDRGSLRFRGPFCDEHPSNKGLTNFHFVLGLIPLGLLLGSYWVADPLHQYCLLGIAVLLTFLWSLLLRNRTGRSILAHENGRDTLLVSGVCDSFVQELLLLRRQREEKSRQELSRLDGPPTDPDTK